MSTEKEIPTLTAKQWEEARHAAAAWGVHDEIETALESLANESATVIATAELEMFKQCRRLLYGFMLDTNSIGLTGAAENLARGIKEQAIAQEKANG